jgi:K+-sensing histidine kinase KdpD
LFRCVKDSGAGIDPEIEPRLFSKFTTNLIMVLDYRMYILKSIIEAHEGRI